MRRTSTAKPKKRPPPLTAADLRASNRTRSSVNHETYRIIYDRMCGAMREFTRLHPRQTTYLFVVPPIIMGRPLYDQSHALRYAYEKAAHNGFRVQAVGEGGIYLDWTPAPVVRKPSAIVRNEVAMRNDEEMRGESVETRRRMRAKLDKKKAHERTTAVLENTSTAKQAAKDLNNHLTSLLKSMETKQ